MIDKEGYSTYLLDDGSSFRWLKIEDYNVFGVMCAGTKTMAYKKQDYSRMDIFISNTGQGNLQNQTVEEYKSKIITVFQYLSEKYGVVVDLQSLRFSQMEINCTFNLQEDFYKYHRVLRLLMFNLPQSFKKLGQVLGVNKEKQRIEAETFYRGNASMEVKIYDKKRQLEQTVQFIASENIMRIEFILKTSQKIKEAFGSSLVSSLTDAKLNEFFYKQFIRLFENPYRRWQTENGNILRNMILRHRRRNRNYWKSNLLSECANIELSNQIPVLLDVKDLLEQVKRLDEKGHYARLKEGILEQCLQHDIFLQKDADKAEEIIYKVHEAYNNYWRGQEPISAPNSPNNGEVV